HPPPNALRVSNGSSTRACTLEAMRTQRGAGVAAPDGSLPYRGPMRRRALLFGSGKGRIPRLRLNPKAVDGEAGHRVATHCEDDLDELFCVVALCQDAPCAIGDKRLAAQFVGDAQHGPTLLAPAGGVRACGDSGDLSFRRARLARSLDVMRPFV